MLDADTKRKLLARLKRVQGQIGALQRMLAEDPDLQAPWATRLRRELRRRSGALVFREVI